MVRTFRDALIHALDGTGVSLLSLSNETGVSYEQLKKLKQNKSKSTNAEDAVKIARFFGVSLEEFLDRPALEDQIEILKIYNRLSQRERDILLGSARGVLASRDR